MTFISEEIEGIEKEFKEYLKFILKRLFYF
jgi:hypothetical protein